MELIRCKSSQELANEASRWCAKHFRPGGQVFVPAGNTPKSLYSLWESQKPSYLKNVQLLQLDDVLTGSQKGVFRKFFEEHLPSFQNQFVPISEGNTRAQAALLGLGLNGHVAFHEPGLPSNFYSGCVKLSKETQSNLNLNPSDWGVTYGLGAFLKTQAILLMVSGEKKRDLFNRFLKESETFPATFLKNHSHLTVLVDFQ